MINFDGIEITPEQQEAINSQVTDLVSKNTSDHLNKAFDGATNKASTLIGIERLASETKGMDFFNRAIPLYKQKLEEKSLADMSELKASYEEKLKNATGDEVLKADFEKMKAALEEKNTKIGSFETEKESLINDYEGKLFNGKKERAILSIMPAIDPNIDEYRVKALKEIAIQEIETEYEKVHFNKDGVLVVTKDFTDYKYETLLADKLKDLAPKEAVTGGNALQTNGANKPATSIVFTKDMDTSQKNQLLEAYLQNAGYTSKVSSVNGVPYSTMYTKLKDEANEALK